jgi:tRNA(adenine34) deaminase
MINNIEMMKIALNEAKNGHKKGEIPVGVVMVKNNKIIYKGTNKKEQLKCATRHAEIEAIEYVSKIQNDWRLDDYILYTTMEPCIMCCGAILQSRIKKVYYLSKNEKFGGIDEIDKILSNNKYNHQVEIEKINNKKLEEEYQNLLRDFFIDKR